METDWWFDDKPRTFCPYCGKDKGSQQYDKKTNEVIYKCSNCDSIWN